MSSIYQRHVKETFMILNKFNGLFTINCNATGVSINISILLGIRVMQMRKEVYVKIVICSNKEIKYS
jgi:hypothetical protein